MDGLGDEPVEQVVHELDLADQRMREQRLPRVHRIAAERGADGEALVGGDVLDESQQLGGERRLRQRLRPLPTDPRWEKPIFAAAEQYSPLRTSASPQASLPWWMHCFCPAA